MKLKYILLFVSLFGFTACFYTREPNRKENAEVSTDTLSYDYKTIKQQASDCGNQADTNCTSVVFKYPLFANQPVLNDTVNYHLANLFANAYPAGKAASLKDAANTFIKTYEDDKQKAASRFTKGMHYSLTGHADIIRQDTNLLTLQLEGYKFDGGAHGMSLTYFINWDVKEHKNLTLDDIFINDYAPKLNQIADTIFRKEENLSPASSLANDYFFKDAKFSLNSNFVITPLGIKFLYNTSEIKPYAAGQTSIEIPYSRINKLLKPGTPAAIYSK